MDKEKVLSLHDKVNLLFTQYEEQQKNKQQQEDINKQQEINNSNKFDLILEVLKEEYFASIESVRHVDEKINKFFVILTIIFTGLFTLLAGSLLKLKFYVDMPVQDYKIILMIFISYIFVLLLVVGVYYLFKILNQLIDSLELIDIHRLPNLDDALKDSDIIESDFISFQKVMITAYQRIITFNDEQKRKKQIGLQNATKLIKNTLVFNGLAMLLLLINNFLSYEIKEKSMAEQPNLSEIMREIKREQEQKKSNDKSIPQLQPRELQTTLPPTISLESLAPKAVLSTVDTANDKMIKP